MHSYVSVRETNGVVGASLFLAIVEKVKVIGEIAEEVRERGAFRNSGEAEAGSHCGCR